MSSSSSTSSKQTPRHGAKPPEYLSSEASKVLLQRFRDHLNAIAPESLHEQGISAQNLQRLLAPDRSKKLGDAEQAPPLFVNRFLQTLHLVLEASAFDDYVVRKENSYLDLLNEYLFRFFQKDIKDRLENEDEKQREARPGAWPSRHDVEKAARTHLARARYSGEVDPFISAILSAETSGSGSTAPAVTLHLMDWFPNNARCERVSAASEKFTSIGANVARSLLGACFPELDDCAIEVKAHKHAETMTNALRAKSPSAQIGVGLYVTSSRMSHGLHFIQLPGLRGHLGAITCAWQTSASSDRPFPLLSWREVCEGRRASRRGSHEAFLRAFVLPRELGEEFVRGVCAYRQFGERLENVPTYDRFDDALIDRWAAPGYQDAAPEDQDRTLHLAIARALIASPESVFIGGWPLVEAVRAAFAQACAQLIAEQPPETTLLDLRRAFPHVLEYDALETPSYPFGIALPRDAERAFEVLKAALFDDLMGAGISRMVRWYTDYLVTYYRWEQAATESPSSQLNRRAGAYHLEVVDRILARWARIARRSWEALDKRDEDSRERYLEMYAPWLRGEEGCRLVKELLPTSDPQHHSTKMLDSSTVERRKLWTKFIPLVRHDRGSANGDWRQAKMALLEEMRSFPRRIDLDSIADVALKRRMKAIVRDLVWDSSDPLRLGDDGWCKLRLLRDFTDQYS